MRILFAEDDESQQLAFGDVVHDWNEQNEERLIEVIKARTVSEAEILLEQQHLDAAVLDLRLPGLAGTKSDAKNGNQLAHLSLDQVGIPIGIVSGNPNDLDDDLKKIAVLHSFDKGDVDVYQQIVKWVGDQWPMMTVLQSTRRHLSESGAAVFTNRLWPRWKTYAGLTGDDQDELTRIVTRQYVSHLAELLGSDADDNVPSHPYECYIRPALLDSRAHTGDIFRRDGSLWMVLTPQCDMATGKAANVLLARIDEAAPSNWKDNVDKLKDGTLSATNAKKRDKFLRDFVNQNVPISEHFLPPLKDGTPLMVQFREVVTRPLAELNACLDKREASIALAFLPNLIQRFGAYISRTGQPNIDIRHFA